MSHDDYLSSRVRYNAAKYAVWFCYALLAAQTFNFVVRHAFDAVLSLGLAVLPAFVLTIAFGTLRNAARRGHAERNPRTRPTLPPTPH